MQGSLAVVFALMVSAPKAHAQAASSEEKPLVLEVAIGMDFNVGGNVNSGAIGRLNGLATAILPNPYGPVYGTGFQMRFGAGYKVNETTELRGIFTWQRADAELVRMGDIGPSSLYGQFSDYQSLGLDIGVRRYFPLQTHALRAYGEATIGAAFIDNIDVEFAAPQSNQVFDSTDFYDRSAAFTWSLGAGIVFPANKYIDITAQIGLRFVGGLAEVDQFAGTGLETINDNSARITFPLVAGVRFKFP